MPFNRALAKQDGWSDEEIDAYLASRVSSMPEIAPSALMTGTEDVEALREDAGTTMSARSLAELGGGIVGGAVASKLVPGTGKIGQTVGSMVARVAGTGIGGAAGDVAAQAAGDGPIDLREASQAGARQASLEGAGQIFSRVINRGIRPIRGGGEVSSDLLNVDASLKTKGSQLLPGQLKPKSGALSWLTGISEGGWFSSTRMKEASEKQHEAVTKLSESVADQLSSKMLREETPEDAATALADTIFGGKEGHAAIRKQMYSDLDTFDVTVTLPTELKAGGKPVPLTKHDQGMLKRLLARTEPAQGPTALTFERAQDLRSQLIAEGKETKDPVLRGRAKLLAKAVDEAMEQAASANPQLLEGWRAANAFTKDGKRAFDNKFIATLSSDPTVAEKFGEQIAGVGGAEPSRKIHLIKEAMEYASKSVPDFNREKAKDAMDSIRAGWFQARLKKASRQGPLEGGAFLSSINDPKTQRLMRELFEPKQHKAIMDFARVAHEVSIKPENQGRMMIQLLQAGGLAGGVSLATGSLTAGGAAGLTALIAPSLVSRVLVSDRGAVWLTRGLNVKLTSPARAGLSARLLNAAVELAQPGELQIQFPPGQEPGSAAAMIQAHP